MVAIQRIGLSVPSRAASVNGTPVCRFRLRIVTLAEFGHGAPGRGGISVQALIELLAGLIALLVTAALSQFGVDIERATRPQSEVHRISDCAQPTETPSVGSRGGDNC